jgi:hypothetical protein
MPRLVFCNTFPQSTFDLRVLAELADRGASSSSGGGQACLRDCSEKFMKSFSVCINDRAQGVCEVVGYLCKLVGWIKGRRGGREEN